MMHESMRGGLWRLVLLTFYVLFVCPTGACTSSAPESDTGSAELIGSTREALSASDVTRVVVTVTGAGIAAPLVQSLVRVGGRWQGTIGGIPAGSGRSFHGDAFDASSTVIYTGDATVHAHGPRRRPGRWRQHWLDRHRARRSARPRPGARRRRHVPVDGLGPRG